MRKASVILAIAAVSAPASAFATTYQVGPSRSYTSLSQLSTLLEPGDVVEVDGDATYAGDIHIKPESAGTAANPVTIRGISVNGHRPIIHGGSSFGIVLHGNHTVFENFEVSGASGACVINKADDLTLRNLVVHDCPGHGIMGTDSESGDQTLEFIEVYGCGNGVYDHQIYLATDESMYPGSRVRLQHSYIHDGNGGNDFKSRAERNEIYFNWIESPHYHVLDLIGVDGQDQLLAREDSDVVGNVLIQNGQWQIARIGGDGTGATRGRYRFAYNTIVASSQQTSLFRLQDEIESLAIHDNVFVLAGGGSPAIVNDNDAVWTQGQQVAGHGNFVQSGFAVPAFFSGTLLDASVPLANVAAGDLMPVAMSSIVDAASAATGPSNHEVPNALGVPGFVPPTQNVNPALVALVRPSVGALDIGAFEFGSGSPGDPGEGGAPPGGEGGAGAGSSSGGGTAEGGAGAGSSGGATGDGGAAGDGGAPGDGGDTDGDGDVDDDDATTDTNGDGVIDGDDAAQDTNGDGVVDGDDEPSAGSGGSSGCTVSAASGPGLGSVAMLALAALGLARGRRSRRRAA